LTRRKRKAMKILITGGNSFIARNLLEQMGGDYVLMAPNSKELNLLDAEKVLDFIKSGRFDVIIHSATYDAVPKHSTKDPTKVLENNLRMFFNLVRGRDYFGKLINFGSGAEFSREHWIPCMAENYFDRHVPADQYGYSKYVINKYIQSSKNVYNLRLFAVFGKYEDWRVRFISNVCRAAVLGQSIIINQNKFYDFLFIDDLVSVIKWFIQNQPRENVYNVCTGKTIEFKSIAEKIVKISGKKLELGFKEKGLGPEYSGDNSLLMRELAGFTFTPFAAALEVLYRWYDQNQQVFEG